METWIGARWHHWVSQRAEPGHRGAAVALDEVRRPIELLLRAGGGHARVAPAAPVAVGGERSFWQRVAGSGHRAALGQLDAEVLALPEQLAVHPDSALNRALYLWLAALGARLQPGPDWLAANLAATHQVLRDWPGLVHVWARLQVAELAPRQPCTAPAACSPARPGGAAGSRTGAGAGGPGEANAEAERRVQRALRDLMHPGEVDPRLVAPVWCWLRPAWAPPMAGGLADHRADQGNPRTAPAAPGTSLAQRLRARRQAQPTARAPLLLAPKGEWLKTFGDPFTLNRAEDEDDEPGDSTDARVAAEELEQLTLQANPRRAGIARLRFDLDLPAAAQDDLPLGPGQWLPEWDARHQALLPDRVLAQDLAAREAPPWQPAPALQAQARALRRRLARQQAAPRLLKGQRDGDALDLDACVRHLNHPVGPAAVYQRQQRCQRDLACLLLADLSLSTDAYANPHQRVIDVVRDTLFTFGSALQGGGDAFAMLGFSSVRRQLRLHPLKDFDEAWGAPVLARVGAVKPGYHTRMGAALRAATRRLQRRPERQRLLLLLTDGKPHDLDGYEGRWGQEDTRQAVLEARAAGLLPFAVGIDATAPTVLPQLFGSQGWAWVQRPEALPARLAELYGQLRR